MTTNGNVSLELESEVAGLVLIHGDLPMMAEAEAAAGVWKTAAAYGFTLAASLSSVPAAVTPAVASSPQSTATVASLEETRRSVFDDAAYEAMTPEKRKEVDAIAAEMHAVTLEGKAMPAAIVDRVMQLLGA